MTYKSIAIDGPAGSGKSTVANIIAEQCKFNYLNSGSLYRAIGLYLLENKIDYSDENNITSDVLKAIEIKWSPGVIYLGNVDVTTMIRRPLISTIASKIAVFATIRNYVNQLIHSISKHHDIVIDGRDIGSVVLPHATLKIFLDASIEVRAMRIFKMNKSLGIDKPLEEIEQEVASRDERDYTRAIAPLIKAPDAILIDCSDLSIHEVVDEIETILEDRIK